MTPKILFQKDKELSEWWAAVAHHDNFGKVLTYARAQMLERMKITADELSGSRVLENTLRTLADAESKPFGLPKSGIRHMTDADKSEKEN